MTVSRRSSVARQGGEPRFEQAIDAPMIGGARALLPLAGQLARVTG